MDPVELLQKQIADISHQFSGMTPEQREGRLAGFFRDALQNMSLAPLFYAVMDLEESAHEEFLRKLDPNELFELKGYFRALSDVKGLVDRYFVPTD